MIRESGDLEESNLSFPRDPISVWNPLQTWVASGWAQEPYQLGGGDGKGMHAKAVQKSFQG